VARVRHVGVDTTVGTVCASSLLWCLVDLDVLDDEVGGVEALGVGVGFGVFEEPEEEFSRLNGPTGTGDAHLLALCASTSSSSVASHWDRLLVLLDVSEEVQGALELHAIDGLGCFAGVFERDT